MLLTSKYRESKVGKLKLSYEQHKVLEDICQVMEIPHAAQEVLSAERTPTLASALPIYELMILKWKALAQNIPQLSHAIQAGIDKLERYVQLSRKTYAYATSMSTRFHTGLLMNLTRINFEPQ